MGTLHGWEELHRELGGGTHGGVGRGKGATRGGGEGGHTRLI